MIRVVFEINERCYMCEFFEEYAKRIEDSFPVRPLTDPLGSKPESDAEDTRRYGMVDAGSGIPSSSPNINRLSNRQKGPLQDPASHEASPAQESDRFEPSPSLTSQQTAQTPRAQVNDGRRDEAAAGSEQPQRIPIQNQEEANQVVSQTEQQITKNPQEAALAQAQLNPDSVLSLIA